jgi:sigma-B regulation protein RsbQ
MRCLQIRVPSGIEATVLDYPTDENQSHGQLVQFLESSLAASAPFVLVAESFSTPLAIQWAAKGRTNLKGLVLCGGFAASPVLGWLRGLGLLLSPICFLVQPPKTAIRFFLVGTDASNSLVTAVKGAIGSVKPSVLAHRMRQTLTCNALSALGDLRAPILLLHPTQDKILSSACLKQMLDILPQANVEMISGPHMLLQAKAQESAEVIAKYVRQFWTS